MTNQISKIFSILMVTCMSLMQLPFVFVAIQNSEWLPGATILIPLELLIAIAVLVSVLFKNKLTIALSIVFLLIVGVDLYFSLSNPVSFLSPFSTASYYKIVPITPETIRYPNRELMGLFVAAMSCLVVIGSRIWGNRITNKST